MTYVIDYGSSITKAGCSRNKEPQIVCSSQTLRTRRDNKNLSVSGNQITQEFYKVNSKNVFENFDNIESKGFEDFNDYLFNDLQIKKNDQLIFTEPLGISKKFRKQAFELFFECYELSNVFPCVDSIAASYNLLKKFKSDTGLIISIGDKSTTTLPFVKSNLDTSKVRKMNVGSYHMKNMMMKLFDLKYNNFQGSFNQKYIDGFFERFSFMAYDYKTQLNLYKDIEYLGRFDQAKYQSWDLKT